MKRVVVELFACSCWAARWVEVSGGSGARLPVLLVVPSFPVMHLHARHSTKTNTGGRFSRFLPVIYVKAPRIGSWVTRLCRIAAWRLQSGDGHAVDSFWGLPLSFLTLLSLRVRAVMNTFERFAIWVIDWRVIRSLHFATTLIFNCRNSPEGVDHQ